MWRNMSALGARTDYKQKKSTNNRDDRERNGGLSKNRVLENIEGTCDCVQIVNADDVPARDFRFWADWQAGRKVARYAHDWKSAKKGQEREYVTKKRAITAPKREQNKAKSVEIKMFLRLREVGLKKKTSWYLKDNS